MKIETAFALGQKVYIPVQEWSPKKRPCSTCDAKGTVDIKGASFCCPNCHGDKKVLAPSWKHKPLEARVTIIEVGREKGHMYQLVSSYQREFRLYVEDIRASEVECLALCEELDVKAKGQEVGRDSPCCGENR